MICPNCGSSMSDKRKRCERCGEDLTLYKKVLRASNLYYNNGLAKARVRDLSGAVVALCKSLDLNKLNTNARNLLGLIYYEMGETVAALSEWVISRHFQPVDNDADEYIDKVQSNLTRLDAFNQAIKRYNTALGLAKQGSDDLAIIQLKKVVSLNTNFIRAYQLLALLLMKTGDTDKARKFLLKASKIDVSNTTTLRYMQEIEAPALLQDRNSNPEAEQQGSSGSIMPISSYREDKPNIMAYVNLVIGVVIGLAAMAFLVIPTIKNNKAAESNPNGVDSSYSLEQFQEKDKEISELKNDKAELEKEKQQLQSQIDNMSATGENADAYSAIFSAAQLYLTELEKPVSQQNLVPIADQLAGLDAAKLETEASTNLYNTLKDATFLKANDYYYKKGHNSYNSGKYEDALTDLTKAITFAPDDVDAIYFTARAYHRKGDNTNAATYYNMVITDYPDSSRVSDAKLYLAQVQDQQE